MVAFSLYANSETNFTDIEQGLATYTHRHLIQHVDMGLLLHLVAKSFCCSRSSLSTARKIRGSRNFPHATMGKSRGNGRVLAFTTSGQNWFTLAAKKKKKKKRLPITAIDN